MAEVKLSTYSGSVSSGNWTPALSAAWSALITAGGGRLLIDVPLVKMITAFTMSTNGDLPITIQGDGANRIWLAGSGTNMWNLSGFAKLRLRNLLVTGDDTAGTGTTVDCANGFSISSCLNVVIDDVIMCGIRPSGNVLNFSNVNVLKINDCDLSGNGGGTVNVQTTDQVEINNTAFIDYLAVLGYRTKVGDGAGWLQIYNPPSGVVGARKTLVKISNCRFDEASAEAIHINGYDQVIIDQPRINVGSYGYAIAISLDTVKHAIIRQPHIGYNNADRPIIKAISCGYVDVIQCGKDSDPAAPFRIVKDGGTVLKNLQAVAGISVTTI